MKEDVGKFGKASKGDTGIIYVPAGVVKDSLFPFTFDDDVRIRIDGKRLVIEKAGKDG
jgi:hypothetical protein